PRLYLDPQLKAPFNGTITNSDGVVTVLDERGDQVVSLYGEAVQVGAPLTAKAFERGLGDWGGLVVTLCVGLFALSTALGASYYGDRCAVFLLGSRAVTPYRVGYCVMFFIGSISVVPFLWKLVDLAFAVATIPNVIALVIL